MKTRCGENLSTKSHMTDLQEICGDAAPSSLLFRTSTRMIGEIMKFRVIYRTKRKIYWGYLAMPPCNIYLQRIFSDPVLLVYQCLFWQNLNVKVVSGQVHQISLR